VTAVPHEVETFYVRDGAGEDWHIEGPDVDTMLCGLPIDVVEGEVRTRPPTRLCRECDARRIELADAASPSYSRHYHEETFG
jgi:hypothetical protein